MRRARSHEDKATVHNRFRAGLRYASVPRDPDSFESFRATVREALQLPAEWPEAAWRIRTLGGQTELTFENYERVDELMLDVGPAPGGPLDSAEHCRPDLIMDKTPVHAVLQSQMTAVSMLCEIFDNSIEATMADPDAQPEIACLFGGPGKFIWLHDNGPGISAENLQLWLRPGKGAFIQNTQGISSSFNWHKAKATFKSLSQLDLSLYLSGKIGKFGVGAKKALYGLGEHVELRTRSRNLPVYQSVHQHSKNANADDPWEAVFNNDPSLLEGVTAEHFTDITVSRLRQTSGLLSVGQEECRLSPKRAKKARGNDGDQVDESLTPFGLLCRSLAKIYFFYTHGPDALYDAIRRTYGAEKSVSLERAAVPASAPVKQESFRTVEMLMGVTDSSSAQPLNHGMSHVPLQQQLSLGEMQTAELEFLERAKSSFPFEILVLKEGRNTGAHCVIRGVFFYYPVHKGKETLPEPEELFDTEKQLDGRGNRKSGIYYYWNGKLLQREDSLCSSLLDSKRNAKDKGAAPPSRVLDNRLRGFIFLPRQVPVTDDKTQVRETGDGIAKHFPRLLTSTRDALHAWVLDCHRQFDQEAVFEGESRYDPDRQITIYQKLSFSGKQYKAGMSVKLRTEGGVCGKVVHYWHQGRFESFEGFACVRYIHPNTGLEVELDCAIGDIVSISSSTLQNWEKSTRKSRKKYHVADLKLYDLQGRPEEEVTSFKAGSEICVFGIQLVNEAGANVTAHASELVDHFQMQFEVMSQYNSVCMSNSSSGHFEPSIGNGGVFLFNPPRRNDVVRVWEMAGVAKFRWTLKLKDSAEQDQKLLFREKSYRIEPGLPDRMRILPDPNMPPVLQLGQPFAVLIRQLDAHHMAIPWSANQFPYLLIDGSRVQSSQLKFENIDLVDTDNGNVRLPKGQLRVSKICIKGTGMVGPHTISARFGSKTDGDDIVCQDLQLELHPGRPEHIKCGEEENSGRDQVVANGDDLCVEARLLDQWWNPCSGEQNLGVMIVSDCCSMDVTPVSDAVTPIYRRVASRHFLYDSTLDTVKSSRVKKAGQGQLTEGHFYPRDPINGLYWFCELSRKAGDKIVYDMIFPGDVLQVNSEDPDRADFFRVHEMKQENETNEMYGHWLARRDIILPLALEDTAQELQSELRALHDDPRVLDRSLVLTENWLGTRSYSSTGQMRSTEKYFGKVRIWTKEYFLDHHEAFTRKTHHFWVSDRKLVFLDEASRPSVDTRRNERAANYRWANIPRETLATIDQEPFHMLLVDRGRLEQPRLPSWPKNPHLTDFVLAYTAKCRRRVVGGTTPYYLEVEHRGRWSRGLDEKSEFVIEAPLGEPISGFKVVILNEDRQICPGISGELRVFKNHARDFKRYEMPSASEEHVPCLDPPGQSLASYKLSFYLLNPEVNAASLNQVTLDVAVSAIGDMPDSVHLQSSLPKIECGVDFKPEFKLSDPQGVDVVHGSLVLVSYGLGEDEGIELNKELQYTRSLTGPHFCWNLGEDPLSISQERPEGEANLWFQFRWTEREDDENAAADDEMSVVDLRATVLVPFRTGAPRHLMLLGESGHHEQSPIVVRNNEPWQLLFFLADDCDERHLSLSTKEPNKARKKRFISLRETGNGRRLSTLSQDVKGAPLVLGKESTPLDFTVSGEPGCYVLEACVTPNDFNGCKIYIQVEPSTRPASLIPLHDFPRTARAMSSMVLEFEVLDERKEIVSFDDVDDDQAVLGEFSFDGVVQLSITKEHLHLPSVVEDVASSTPGKKGSGKRGASKSGSGRKRARASSSGSTHGRAYFSISVDMPPDAGMHDAVVAFGAAREQWIVEVEPGPPATIAKVLAAWNMLAISMLDTESNTIDVASGESQLVLEDEDGNQVPIKWTCSVSCSTPGVSVEGQTVVESDDDGVVVYGPLQLSWAPAKKRGNGSGPGKEGTVELVFVAQGRDDLRFSFKTQYTAIDQTDPRKVQARNQEARRRDHEQEKLLKSGKAKAAEENRKLALLNKLNKLRAEREKLVLKLCLGLDYERDLRPNCVQGDSEKYAPDLLGMVKKLHSKFKDKVLLMPEVFQCTSKKVAELASMALRSNRLTTVFCDASVWDSVRRFVDQNSSHLQLQVVNKDLVRAGYGGSGRPADTPPPEAFIGMLADDRFVQVSRKAVAFFGNDLAKSLVQKCFFSTFIVRKLADASAFQRHVRDRSGSDKNMYVCYEETERSAMVMREGGAVIAGGRQMNNTTTFGVFAMPKLLKIQELETEIEALGRDLPREGRR